MVYELEKEHKKSSLMCKKKEELAKEIMRLEHNVNVMNERLNNQANAIKHYEQESRNKAIDEFVGMLEFSLMNNYRHLLKIDMDEFEWLTTDSVLTHIRKVKEQLKGGAVDGINGHS